MELRAERERRLADRRAERIADRREKWQEQCRLEERKRIEEEEQRKREEEERESYFTIYQNLELGPTRGSQVLEVDVDQSGTLK